MFLWWRPVLSIPSGSYTTDLRFSTTQRSLDWTFHRSKLPSTETWSGQLLRFDCCSRAFRLILALIPAGDILHSLWKRSGTDSVLHSTALEWNSEETRSTVVIHDRHSSSQCFSLRSNTIRTVQSTENDLEKSPTSFEQRQSSHFHSSGWEEDWFHLDFVRWCDQLQDILTGGSGDIPDVTTDTSQLARETFSIADFLAE